MSCGQAATGLGLALGGEEVVVENSEPSRKRGAGGVVEDSQSSNKKAKSTSSKNRLTGTGKMGVQHIPLLQKMNEIVHSTLMGHFGIVKYEDGTGLTRGTPKYCLAQCKSFGGMAQDGVERSFDTASQREHCGKRGC